MIQITAIGFTDDDLRERAEILAKQLDLTVENTTLPRLCVTPDKLVLLIKNFSPLFVDFNSSLISRRGEAGKKQGLIRACKPKAGLKILDTTAGWGRDAGLLAHFGADVCMLERQPIMAALLADGLNRMQSQGHLVLLDMDAKDYLQHLKKTDYPDVIYIDPMHPTRQKKALVKKDMQALQQMIGADTDVLDLLQLALTRVRQRVVVKWPQRLKPLLSPDYSIDGKTIRFDVYVPQL